MDKNQELTGKEQEGTSPSPLSAHEPTIIASSGGSSPSMEEATQPQLTEETKGHEQEAPSSEDVSLLEDIQAENNENISSPSQETEEQEEPIAMPAAPAPAPVPSGVAEKLFSALSYAGFPVLLLLAGAMSFFEVWQVRDLWFSDEVRLADAFMNLLGGDWLMLTMNGLPYPDKPPLYFWFMKALMAIPGVTVPMVMFLSVALSHVCFIASIWILARGTGYDRRESFASGLVALGCLYISGAACYPRMDLLFSAVVTLGMTCLYRGWIKSFAPFYLAAGFLLMGAATLIKSPLGIAFAIVCSILFLFWRGTPGRLNDRDGLPGFALMLVMLLVWAGTLYLSGHQDYLRDMVLAQLFGRIMTGGHHAQVWWYYLAALPIIWLPWVLVILFVNWFAALRAIPSAWRARKEQGGSSWLWIWLISGIAMLSAVQAKIAVYALPLLAPLSVLTARSILRLSPSRSRCFFSLASVILALAGLALVLLEAYPAVLPYAGDYLPAVPAAAAPWLKALHGTMYMGGILILLSIVLLFFSRLTFPGGALLITSLGMILFLLPYQAIVAPSMDSLLSPRSQAAAMAEKIRAGYAPAAFNVYPGAYAWHINEILPQQGKRLNVPDLTTEADRDSWIKQHPKAVMAMPAASWNEWKDKPSEAEVVLTSWMVHKPYVVVAFTSSDSAELSQRSPQEADPVSSNTTPLQQ